MTGVPVLVLGTDHLVQWTGEGGNPDILSERRQQELEELAARLARFSPNKVAVEVLASKQSELDELYESFTAGERQSDRNETVQIGCRLAQRTGASLFAVDANWTLAHDLMEEYFETHPAERVDSLSPEALGVVLQLWGVRDELSVSEVFARMNEPPMLYVNDREYLDRCVPIAAGDTWAGVELVASWYRRNLKIFANLQRIAEPEDRIFVLIGSGHAPSLRHFLEVSGRFELVDPLDFLRGSQA